MPFPDGRPGEGTESWNLTPSRSPAEKRPYLLVVSGPQLGEIHALAPGREIVLGRDPTCDVQLRDTGVSRRHAGILAGKDGARLRDLGSTNGVFVEAIRVADFQMQDGQRIQMGMHTSLKYCLCDDLEIAYQRRLAEGALLDPETGVFNRRHFEDRLGAELVTTQRYARPMSLLAVEVDGFLQVLEAHGRPAAEEALGLVARLVKSAVRREDVLARLGAEQFGVVARETPVSAGRALGERIRKAVEQGRLSVHGQDLLLTVSVGVAGIDTVGSYTPARSEAEALGIAVRAMRQSLAAGGNRVTADGPLSLP
jgi:two-component system, cell cycle response regulator